MPSQNIASQLSVSEMTSVIHQGVTFVTLWLWDDISALLASNNREMHLSTNQLLQCESTIRFCLWIVFQQFLVMTDNNSTENPLKHSAHNPAQMHSCTFNLLKFQSKPAFLPFSAYTSVSVSLAVLVSYLSGIKHSTQYLMQECRKWTVTQRSWYKYIGVGVGGLGGLIREDSNEVSDII